MDNKSNDLPTQEFDDEYDNTPWEWSEVVMEVLTNKDFLSSVDRCVDKIIEAWKTKNVIEQGRLDIDKEKVNSWRKLNERFLVYRFTLSGVTLLGLFIAMKEHYLPVELIGALLTGVIASLFVPPRKE